MRDRVILHSDMNCCYASIEHLYHPEYAGQPLAVGGDPEERHGIILTADYGAKKYGVKVGMALWQALECCPNLIIVRPRMDLYLRFSRMAREIYREYTDLVEPFGIDECWLDVTDSEALKGDGLKIAEEIRGRMKAELGITVSVGVSYNKIFAKLGSDYKKPDAVTTMYREEVPGKVWPLPASDLLYVGSATKRRLAHMGILTIGDLAHAEVRYLEAELGKMGWVLHGFANGYDETPVALEGTEPPIKSVGNTMTTPKDLTTDEEVKVTFYCLAESVGARLRENGFCCGGIEIWVREAADGLPGFSRQMGLPIPTNITGELAEHAFALFHREYDWRHPVRGLGIRGIRLSISGNWEQPDLFTDVERRNHLKQADVAVDEIRKRFGYGSVQRGLMYRDRLLAEQNIKEEHVVYPHAYRRDKGQ